MTINYTILSIHIIVLCSYLIISVDQVKSPNTENITSFIINLIKAFSNNRIRILYLTITTKVQV